MDEFEEKHVEEILYSEFGNSASFLKYAIEPEVAIKYVMDTVKEFTNESFSVYWVGGGHPKVFCLNGFSEKIILLSMRYISLSAFLKQALFIDSFEDDLHEKSILKVISEMALRKRDTDFATMTFLKQIIGKGHFLSFGENEYADILHMDLGINDERYMVLWFFGLAHEIGHFFKWNSSADYTNTYFSESWILEKMDEVMLNHPESLKLEILSRAQDKNSGSIVELNRLCNEGCADIFACNVLFDATIKLMHEYKETQFDIDKFIEEILSFQFIIDIINRCQRAVNIRSDDSEFDIELECMNIAHTIRSLFVLRHLEYIATIFLFKELTEENLYLGIQHVNNIAAIHYQSRIKAEQGFNAAIAFISDPHRMANHWFLFEKFQKQLLQSGTPSQIEAQHFCKFALSLKKDGKLFNTLLKITENPEAKIARDKSDGFIFFSLWATGPNNYSQPLKFMTEKGDIYLVFLDYSALFEAIYEHCSIMFIGEYQLSANAIHVHDKLELQYRYASIVEHSNFRLIFEETKEFNSFLKKYMPEIVRQ